MKEFPVFIPFGAEHLAATVTLPDEEPSGLVLLMTGTGAPRSHRYQLWTRAARDLGRRGVASIRLDYLGLGDSTGATPEVSLQATTDIQSAVAVARFGLETLGLDRLAVAGNCSGATTALAVAAEVPECIGAVCILARVLDPSGVNRLVINARRSKLAAIVRSNGLLNRMAEPLRGRKGKPSSGLVGSLGGALRRGHLLFLYSEADTDAYNEKAMAYLKGMLASLPKEQRSRFELRILPLGPLSGFESLEVQDMVIGVTVDWLAASLGGGADALEAGAPGARVDAT